ncbi:Hypothetical predicted protein [Olea europaea subsp. europaea]|uniref:Uncharacterized protein n=1 Tax=Olea europaea subsp. europaea TaxID=158383 RepID=A0A8S0S506_OLEEU|nr:Hypothetical predicted protein [Olea europaea subsp. europaea]
MVQGAAESPAFTQQQMSPNFIPLDPTNAMLYGSAANLLASVRSVERVFCLGATEKLKKCERKRVSSLWAGSRHVTH